MAVKARVLASYIQRELDGDGEVRSENIFFNAVYAEDGPNKSFSVATPILNLNMLVTNKGAIGSFEVGKTYDLTFAEAEVE